MIKNILSATDTKSRQFHSDHMPFDVINKLKPARENLKQAIFLN